MAVLKLDLDGTELTNYSLLLQTKNSLTTVSLSLGKFIIFKAGSSPFLSALVVLLETFGLEAEKRPHSQLWSDLEAKPSGLVGFAWFTS